MIFRADVCFALFLDIYCAVAKHFHTAMCCFYKDQGLQSRHDDACDLKTGQMIELLSSLCASNAKAPEGLLLFECLDRLSQLLYEQTASWIN
jgi:hypothetical protein